MTETVAQLSERIARAFDVPLLAGTRQHRVRVSIGAAVYPDGGRTADELLANSHLAFCRAKATRRGSYVIFENAIRQELEARLTLEAELALAAERNEFELFYQPQVRLVDGGLIGAEALIRWRHPVRGLSRPRNSCRSSIPPRFRTGLRPGFSRPPAGRHGSGSRADTTFASASIFRPRSFSRGDLATSVAEILDATGLTPSLLELEVTEDILLLDEERVLDMFRRIQELGVRIVFDDFGTGYASLSYLKKFPLDGLKIDRSFVLELLGRFRRCGDRRLHHRSEQATGPVGDRGRHREPRDRRSPDQHGMRGGAGLFLRPADAGAGVRRPIPVRREPAAEASGAGKAA